MAADDIGAAVNEIGTISVLENATSIPLLRILMTGGEHVLVPVQDGERQSLASAIVKVLGGRPITGFGAEAMPPACCGLETAKPGDENYIPVLVRSIEVFYKLTCKYVPNGQKNPG